MLFWKRRKRGSVSRQARQHALEPEGAPTLFRIDLDMMVKGAVLKRGRQTIRQFGVMVGGSTRIVTSGDVVDRATYDALLAAGAVRPMPTEKHAAPDLPPPQQESTPTQPHREG